MEMILVDFGGFWKKPGAQCWTSELDAGVAATGHQQSGVERAGTEACASQGLTDEPRPADCEQAGARRAARL